MRAAIVLCLLFAPLLSHGHLSLKSGALRKKSYRHRASKKAKKTANAVTVLLDETRKANEKLFNYESAQQKDEEKDEKKAHEKEVAHEQAQMRFAHAQQQAKAQAFPAVAPNAGVYNFGGGRGPQDFHAPYRGNFGALNRGYGPMTSVPNPLQGMGSMSPLIDPRGFGATGQNTNISDLFAVKSMFPSLLTPILPQNGNVGYGNFGYASPFPAVMNGFGHSNLPFPPFSGKQFRSLGPHGPYTMDLNLTLAGGTKTNTTLMGPLPFGPYGSGGPVTPGQHFGPYAYGGLPQFVNRGQIPVQFPNGMTRHPGAFVPGVPNYGIQAPFSMPSPYPFSNMGMGASGFTSPFGGVPGHSMGMGNLPGVSPTFNPGILMHHQATMGQTTLGQFPIPGLLGGLNGGGAGYPHPDRDRYHTVPVMPPPMTGGEVAAAAAFF